MKSATPVSRWLILFGVYCGLAFSVYAPAFPGGPVSDDYLYLMNPWVRELSVASLPELFDPRSQPTLALNNYAPIRPILHGLQWQLFYDESSISATNYAYHVTNVLVHGIASGLLAMLLVQASLPFAAAAIGAGLFLLHPANVEAVAWLCELWSGVALAFGLGALLLQRRVPALALVLFALALLTKPHAVCVLPVALLRQWSFRNEPGGRRGWAWMGGWLLTLAAITSAQLLTFYESASAAHQAIHPDLAVQTRTVFALAGRYLAMAVTGFGVATFQQPPAAVSLLDPWWLFGLAATLAISGLAFAALRRGDEEAAWWVWGPAAFLPVSQVFPFLYPFADRYLLFMLPGLIGGVLLAGARIGRSIGTPARRAMLARAAGRRRDRALHRLRVLESRSRGPLDLRGSGADRRRGALARRRPRAPARSATRGPSRAISTPPWPSWRPVARAAGTTTGNCATTRRMKACARRRASRR